MQKIPSDIQADLDAVSRIPVVASILEVVCRTTGMRFAAIARVTEDRWVACAVKDDISFGLVPGSELKLETTICHEIRQSGNAVIINNVAEDPDFVQHHTPAMYGFQSYISVPIILKDGQFFGTLCAIDPLPAKLDTPEVKEIFRLMVDLIAFHLSAIQQLDTARVDLREERKISELREQFIAILGHDLRNPISAILNSAQLLQRMNIGERGDKLAHVIQDASYRIKGLIDNILDFASGRLGGGINLDIKKDNSIEATLRHIIEEMNLIWPGRFIETHFELNAPVPADGKRIAQLFSNLLGNALSYGQKDRPIIVKASSNEHEFVLSVANAGNKISAVVMDRLFQPFSRGEVVPRKEGLGLGLYIAAEIARAHNGSIDVESTDEQTIFTLRVPIN